MALTERGFAIIFIIIYCVIIIGINWMLRKLSIKKIAASKSAKESIRIRETYRITRIVIIVVHSAILFFLFYKTLDLLVGGNSMPQQFIFLGLIGLVIVSYGQMSLPISGTTVDELNTDKKFALYLRGFESDSYEISHNLKEIIDLTTNLSSPPIQKQNPSHSSFSEEFFYKALKKYMPAYSVGMTKELESPHGCHRVYLDDETWKEDVSLLISKAELIFIHLHYSESCIWEILQSAKNHSGKTVYLIDSMLVYKRISEKLQEEFPSILLDQYDKIMEIGYQARIKYLDPDYLNFDEKEELENFYKMIDMAKENRDRFASDNLDEELQDIEEEFLDKKAKIHLAVFSNGHENKMIEYSNTENGYKELLKTIMADKR